MRKVSNEKTGRIFGIVTRAAAGAMAALVAGTALTAVPYNVLADEVIMEWREENGVKYWYENGVRQGVKYREDGSIDASYRGKEIYDPSSNAWYWLDCVQNGAVAKDKDVYQESQADDAGNIGKWVRYDADGHMVKGWNEKDGSKYYFDPVYGTMAKGTVTVDGKKYEFDNATGKLMNGVIDDEKKQISLSDCIVTIPQDSYVFDGAAIKPIVTVKYGNKIISTTEYTVSYSDNVNVGTATFIIPANSDSTVISGSVAKTFDIIERENDIEWSISEDGKLTVTGSSNGKLYVLGKNEYGDTTYVYPWDERKNEIKSAYINVTGFTDLRGLFSGCENLKQVDLSDLDTSNVTDMSHMFFQCYNLKSIDMSGLDTSNVTDMSEMFYVCIRLKSIDVRGWDTSNVTNMARMFSSCSSLSSVDVSGFNTSSVTNMESMFYECRELSSVNVNGFDTSRVTDMSYMFCECRGLSSVDVSGFDTSNVTDMNGMFSFCSGLRSVDVRGFNTSNVTDMGGMFYYCSGLSSVDVSGWDTSSVTKMGSMFRDCSSLTEIIAGSGWDTSNASVKDMFLGCGTDHVTIK